MATWSTVTSLALLPALFIIGATLLVCLTIYKLLRNGWNAHTRTLALASLLVLGIIAIVWGVIVTS